MTAADQTPATDSERDQRLGAIQSRFAKNLEAFNVARDTIPPHSMLDDVRFLLDEHDHLTTLLAEQAATIERVVAHRDLLAGRVAAGWQDFISTEVLHKLNLALGSQRTEGDRG